MIGRRPWEEELRIVDRTMRTISSVTDPEDLVEVYWSNIDDLISVGDYVAISRRGEQPPSYLVTRSSRFPEHFNPWTQRERLPRLQGGILGEIAYANAPVIIDDLPGRLSRDDPGWFYLQGFGSLVALPQYDGGQGINATAMLFPPGKQMERSMIPILHWQGGLFGRGTQNLVLKNQLASALKELDGELQVVGEIQRSLLPAALPRIEGFEIAAHYATSARAGGDYYDFFPLAGGGWGVFIADVSGHGTPAAVLMAITHAIAHSEPGTHTPPATLLTYLNERLTRTYTRGGTFVTAFYAVLDPQKKRLRYAAAGHNPPRLVRAGKVISLDQTGSLPLGIMEQNYGEAEVRLERGDVLVMYTDGITEAMAPGGGPIRLFGVERLDRLLLECAHLNADECVQRVMDEVQRFCGGAPLRDDQTIVVVKGAQ